MSESEREQERTAVSDREKKRGVGGGWGINSKEKKITCSLPRMSWIERKQTRS